MRTVSIVLACIAASATSLAVADQSVTTEPQATTTPTPAQPATPAATPAVAPSATAATATPAASVDPEERHLIAMGYKAKVRNGVKVYCRYEDELGSRLGHKERCGTAADWKAAEAATHDDMDDMRRQALKVNPTGK